MSFLLFAHYGALFFMHNHNKTRYFLRFLSRITLYLPSLFWLFLIYGFDTPCVAGLTIIAALIHECGHGACLLLQNNSTGRLKGSLSGFRISKKNTNSYLVDIAVFAAGPLANLSVSFLVFEFNRIETDYMLLFSVINLATALSNLLPIKGYDGYGIIHSLLCFSDKGDRAQSILEVISLTLVVIISILSLYVMARIGDGYWTAGLFILSLIKEVSGDLKKRFS